MPDTARVLFRPPLLTLGAILAGLGLHLALPLTLAPGAPGALLGASLAALAIALFALAVRAMRRHRTPVRTSHPTTALVEDGPYAWTRNPIYVSFLLLQLALALLVHSAWLLVTLPLLWAVLQFGVVAREERYLERRLGRTYRDYRERVRRWL